MRSENDITPLMKLSLYLNIRDFEINYNTYRNTLDSFDLSITFEDITCWGKPSDIFKNNSSPVCLNV